MPSTRCSECGDFGWRKVRPGEPEYIPGYEINVPCESCAHDRRDRQRDELQTISQMTDDERRMRLANIVTANRADTAAMVQACREMVARSATMITIWGSNGNAKSAALVATVNEFLDRGIPAVYIPVWDLLNWLQEGINSNGTIKNDSAYERLEQIKSIRMLAIDEFQGVKLTDWRAEQLRNLIDRRYRDGLDGKAFTLLAMNEDPAELEQRIWSRLRDGRNRLGGNPPVLKNEDADMRPLLRRKA